MRKRGREDHQPGRRSLLGRERASAIALVSRLQEADLALYEQLTNIRNPALDRFFAAMSRAADCSQLAVGIAAALTAFGGERGRRAATRGLVSLGASSAIANGPLKLLSRRPRPRLDGHRPAFVRRPRTFSFPSGHTSPAFAFALAVGTEVPVLLVPLGVLAAAVAYSRIHNRAHYPSDVLAGPHWSSGRRSVSAALVS